MEYVHPDERLMNTKHQPLASASHTRRADLLVHWASLKQRSQFHVDCERMIEMASSQGDEQKRWENELNAHKRICARQLVVARITHTHFLLESKLGNRSILQLAFKTKHSAYI